MSFSKSTYYVLFLDIHDFMKPGKSRTAKSQIDYNNYLKAEEKK